MVATQFNIVPATLYEGDYHLGVAVLINSLYRAGFRGEFLIGYRGALPPWVANAGSLAMPAECITDIADIDGISLRFVPVPKGRSLSAAKPVFMLEMFDQVSPRADAIMMFDADIVAIGPWSFFTEWAQCGVGLCQDMSYPILLDGHPHRHRWRRMAKELGKTCRPLDWYFNGGFVSVRRQDRALLDAWRDLLTLAETMLGPLDRIKFDGRASAMAVPDQDMLNAACMATDVPLSPLGTDGMGFTQGGFAMLHAVTEKPWRAHYIRQALSGQPPGAADKAFWAATDGPLMPFPLRIQRHRRSALRWASAIGRFYKRSN